MKKNIFFLGLLLYVIGCSNNNKMKVEDDGLINNPIVSRFISSYFSHRELVGLKYFNLDITEKSDSLNILIYPIVQKSDSIGQSPLSTISYEDRLIFLRLFPSYYLNEGNSATIMKYKEAIHAAPDFHERYRKFPRWIIRIKDNNYRIDSLSVMPQLLPSVKYIAPSVRGRAKSK